MGRKPSSPPPGTIITNFRYGPSPKNWNLLMDLRIRGFPPSRSTTPRTRTCPWGPRGGAKMGHGDWFDSGWVAKRLVSPGLCEYDLSTAAPGAIRTEVLLGQRSQREQGWSN